MADSCPKQEEKNYEDEGEDTFIDHHLKTPKLYSEDGNINFYKTLTGLLPSCYTDKTIYLVIKKDIKMYNGYTTQQTFQSTQPAVIDPGHHHDTAKGAAGGAAAACVVPGIGPIVGGT